MTPVRLEPAAPRSRVKHSTTEPLRSHCSKISSDKIPIIMLILGSKAIAVNAKIPIIMHILGSQAIAVKA